MANVATLGEAMDQVSDYLVENKIDLSDESKTQLWERYAFDGIRYGEVKTGDVEVAAIKGKKTRKWFHVTITRFDHNGFYEVVCYAL